jgi:hypothetical protein
MIAAEAAYEALGAVVQDAIQKIYLPYLEHEKVSARPEDVAKYDTLIHDYELASDGRSPEAKRWAETARNTFLGNARRQGEPREVAEEMAQDLAGEYYLKSKYWDTFKKFDPTQGVLRLRRWWGGAISYQAFSREREIGRQESRGGGGRADPESLMTGIPSGGESPADEIMSREMLADLQSYVRKSIRDQLTLDVFEVWMSSATDKGADATSIEHDVAAPVMADYRSRGDSVSRTDVYSAWTDVRKLIVQFFERELDMRFSEAQKRKLHLSSVDAITCQVFRCRLAAWVLGR